MRSSALSLGPLLLVLALAAQFAHAADAIDWLNRANKAAQQLNYTGTYVYRHGEREEVLRVSHRVEGKQDLQKIEVLDGPHREFIRINDNVYCHLADGKTVRIDKSAAQRFFPSVVPNDPVRLNQYYIPKLGGNGKVAGQDCQIVILEPRDQYRYTQMIWIDRASSLPLKSQIVNSRGVPVSTFVFSEIEIGNRPDKSLFEVRMAGKRTQVAGTAGTLDDVWVLTPPPGYVRIIESMRPLPGIKTPVLHSVYSDGISNLSVCIEPILDEDSVGLEGLSTEGAMNVYGRRVEGHKVTTLGEVPPAALLDTANSVHKK